MLATIGLSSLDSRSPLGRIVNLKAVPNAIRAALSFGLEDSITDNVRVAVAVNGATVALLAPGELSTGIPLLQDGYNTLDVVPVHPLTSTLPSFYGQQFGRRIFARWNPVEDAALYRVFSSTNGTTYSTEGTTEETFFVSGLKNEGTYWLKLQSQDAAGNVSANSAARAVSIIHRANPVVNPSVNWNGNTIALAWTNPTDANRDAVDIFTNYSNATGNLQSSVIESHPWISVGSNVQAYSFTPSTLGVWRFYVRPSHSDDFRNDDSIILLEANAQSIISGIELNAVESLTVTPKAAGTFLLNWIYNYNTGGDIVRFDLFSGNSFANAETASVPFGNVIASGYGVEDVEFTTGTYGANAWFRVDSVATGGVALPCVPVMGVPDATAPAAPSWVTVVGN